MRLNIRAKQIVGVTAIVGIAVVALSAFFVARLGEVIVDESDARAQMLANTILHHVSQMKIDPADPYASLRSDLGLRSVIQASIYGQGVLYAAILDTGNTVIMHSDETLVGHALPDQRDLTAVAASSPIDMLRVIYEGDGLTLTVRKPMLVEDEDFGSIRVGVSTILMRSVLNESLGRALATAAIALAIAVFVAALLAQLLLRPIHVLRSGLTRLGRGEFGVTLDLPPGDEFGELGSFFNTVSQQLSADRTALAGQKANLQSAVEHLEDAVALFNPSGELLFSNPAMQPTLPTSAIGQPIQRLLAAEHPYRTIVEETLASQASRGPVQARDDALLMTHAVAGKDGSLVGILLVSRNVGYLSQMQSTIAYSRKLVALGRLTAGIAHEVKNPLNAMMIHLELLRTKVRSNEERRQAVPGDREERRQAVPGDRSLVGAGGVAVADRGQAAGADEGILQHVQIIESEIRRLDEVVQGFLKFTRPEDLRLQPVRVTTLFDEILPIVEPEARTHEIRVVVECPPVSPVVNGDAGMLRQAFLNLAINACQAMLQGGTLRLTCALAARGRVEIRVEDTGVGIPPEHLGRIFDLYFTTKDHGTGIGLSMVYRIIQMHDGEVEVQSTPGRGTTFRILLPRAGEV